MHILVFSTSRSYFAFVIIIFSNPLHSLLSPTCQNLIPYGVPIHTTHSWAGSLIHERKLRPNLLPCPSTRIYGFTPLTRGRTPRLSSSSNASFNIVDAILPFGLQRIKQGTLIPRTVQVGPPGYSFTGPLLFSKKSSLPSFPYISAELLIPILTSASGLLTSNDYNTHDGIAIKQYKGEQGEVFVSR